MTDNSKTIIQNDVNIEGNIYEKEDIQIKGKIKGSVKAENIELDEGGTINGNITSTNASLGGKIFGDMDVKKVHIINTADITGNIKQKTLSIEEGAKLNIKTETSD